MKNVLKSKKGQGLTEYGVILVLVAVAGIAIFAIFGSNIRAKIGQVNSAISGDTASYTTQRENSTTRSTEGVTSAGEENSMRGVDNIGNGGAQ